MKFLRIFNLKAIIYQSRLKMLLIFADVSELPKCWAAIFCLNPDFLSYESGNIQNSLLCFSHVILWAWLTVLSVVLQTGHPKWSQFHLFIHGLKNGSNCELCHWLSFLIWLLHWEKQLCHCPIKDRHTKKRSLLSSGQEDNNKRRACRDLI